MHATSDIADSKVLPDTPSHAAVTRAGDVVAPLGPALQRAVDRMSQSRGRLAQEWVPTPGTPGAPGARPSMSAAWAHGGLGGLLRHARRRLAHVPGAAPVIELVHGWWQHHPWRVAGQAVTEELAPRVMGVVRRHPVLAAAAAAGLGCAIVAYKPWRQPWCAQHLRRAPSTLGRWAVSQLARMPLHTVLTTAIAALVTTQAATQAAGAASPGGAAQPGGTT